MNILDTLITDRTQEDVDRVRALAARGYDNLSDEEQAKWDKGLKGAYNYIDLNRAVGALEYLADRMEDAGTTADYVPVIIPHKTPINFDANGQVTQWRKWSDKVWIDYDKPRMLQWAAHLENIVQLWKQTQTIEAEVIPRWDPNGNGYIYITDTMTAGQPCLVTDSNGLMQLAVYVKCDPDKVTAEGAAWDVEQTDTGISATYSYVGGPFPDIQEALSALALRCALADGIVNAVVTFAATLRYAPEQTFGRCSVRWSSLITWGEARAKYGTWGGARGLGWWFFERGYDTHYPFILSNGSEFITKDGKALYCLRR